MIRMMLKLRLCLSVLLVSTVPIVSCKKDDTGTSNEKNKENSKEKDQETEDEESPKKKKKKANDSDDESTKKNTESEENEESPKKKKPRRDDSFEKVGIKACDDYLEKMLQCYKSNKNLSKSALETQKKGLDSVAKIWRNAVQSGGSLATQGVEKGCQSAIKTAKEVMKDLCEEFNDIE